MPTLTLFFLSALLLPCPDCGKDVSSRAVHCPGCGCPGEAIAEAAAAAETAAEEAIPEPDRFLRVETDRETFFALPVEMADGYFAVMPLEKALGVQTLTITPASTNAPIAYQVPQIPVDAPIIRFPIAETNLTYWCTTESAQDTKVVNVDRSGLMTLSTEITHRSIAFASPATNLVAIVSRFPQPPATGAPDAAEIGVIGGADGPTAIWMTAKTPLAAAILPLRPKPRPSAQSASVWIDAVLIDDSLTWQPIQPRILREQGAALLKIIDGEPPRIPPGGWQHPFFQTLYTSLTQTGSQP